MAFEPAKTLGLVVGLIILLTIVAVDLFLIDWTLRQHFDLGSYLTGLLLVFSLPLLALLGYWYYGLLALRYYLDRNALVIGCGAFRRVVPLDSIVSIVPGSQVTVSRGFRGIGWPGYLRGRMRLRGLGVILVHSSEPLDRQLVVVTRSGCYGISPQDTQLFSEALWVRRTLGPTRVVERTVELEPIAALSIWRDRWFWAIIALAFVADAALFGYIARVYALLPARMLLRFRAHGEIGRIVPKTSLLLVSGIGAFTLGINAGLGFLIHRHERLAAYLLVVLSLAIQPILWWAVAAMVSL